jgi:hypothetical protein
MYKDVLRAIAGIDTFPIISLVLFVTTFTLVVLWALRMDRESADRLAALPLDTSDVKGDSRGA